MDNVDGSEHYSRAAEGPTPSLLVVVLDTNPRAWAELGATATLPLAKAVANLLVFINAHLAINNANSVAVVASHCHRAEWLYPVPSGAGSSGEQGGDRQGGSGGQGGDVEMMEAGETDWRAASDDANKYRPFALVEDALLQSLRRLIRTTTEADVASTTTTQMAGALTLALAYINKMTTVVDGAAPSSTTRDVPSKTGGGGGIHSTSDLADTARGGLQSRILVLSVSGDLAHQYIPVMNATFAAQRLRVPLDVLKLAGDTVFLQQAADATRGVYVQPQHPAGLLQYLMMTFLPDRLARRHLVAPTMEMVDFRAACFCHRRVVDVGYVCSICLSIFCEAPEGAICLTCSTHLQLGNYGAKPAVVPRKRKKKKKVANGGVESGSARGTPALGE